MTGNPEESRPPPHVLRVDVHTIIYGSSKCDDHLGQSQQMAAGSDSGGDVDLSGSSLCVNSGKMRTMSSCSKTMQIPPLSSDMRGMGVIGVMGAMETIRLALYQPLNTPATPSPPPTTPHPHSHWLGVGRTAAKAQI
ncbi:hypothetical protein Q8A73_000996 [Channa argus]|nr:hypothetical protein Q8A73_000996 [Channa argus]